MRAPVSRIARRSLLAGVLATCGAARAQSLAELARGERAMAYAFVGGARSTGWLDAEPGRDDLTLPGRLNGAPVRVLLDSGASRSVVDLRLARRLGLKLSDPVTVSDTGGRGVPAAELHDLHLALEGLTLSGLQAVALDLKEVAEAGRDPPVILGRDVFLHLLVDIDPPSRKVAFHDPAAFSPPAGARRLPLTVNGERTRTTVLQVGGSGPLAAEFDLGSQSALIASEAFARARGWLRGRRVSTWVGGSVTGVTPESIATLEGVSLAGVAMPPLPLEMLPTWPAAAPPLVIGLPLLSRFRMVTDYPHDGLWLVPSPVEVARPFRRDRSGLALRPVAGGAEVLHVAAGGPAQAGGWRVGEIVATVDGRPAGGASDWRAGPVGRTVTLGLPDGRVRRLTLADYF